MPGRAGLAGSEVGVVAEQNAQLTGPDLAQGVDVSEIPLSGMLLGHANGEAVLLVRAGGDVFAIAPGCTHYGGPLAEGRCEGTTVHCPWHHARFDARTGLAIGAPALNPLARWQVAREGSRVVVGDKIAAPPAKQRPRMSPASVVIVGAGAAGNACAEMLRQQGYGGPVTLIGAEPNVPVDRPNLSKDYLAGTAPEEWVPLHGPEFYEEQRIELVKGVRAVSLDGKARTVELSDGSRRPYGALLLATGADPLPLPLSARDGVHVHYLRSLADSKAIIARVTARPPANTVVVGASFIGLEVAASLRTRGLEVHVVGREERPLERVLGRELSDFVRRLHEDRGVKFHLGRNVQDITPDAVVLDDGKTLAAELVVAGIGVKPSLGLAEQAGLKVDQGVLVDEFLESSLPGVYAAGDLARWPYFATGQSVRIEHWVVAERMGQTAARNMLGLRQPFDAVPFFWSTQHDVTVNYVGHAERWDRIEVDGDLEARDARLVYRAGGKVLAVVTVGRDPLSLKAEAALERNDASALAALLG